MKAQAAPTIPGVRETVIRELLSRTDFDARAVFLSDSVEVRRFLQCSDTPGGRRCMLADTIPLYLLSVRMHRSMDSANVRIGRYRNKNEPCPLHGSLEPSVPSLGPIEELILVYRSGLWIEARPRRGAIC